MAKLTAWLVTLIGVIYVLQAPGIEMNTGSWGPWVIALAFLVIGIGKLQRNYGKRR